MLTSLLISTSLCDLACSIISFALFNNHGQSDYFELKIFKVFNGFNVVNYRVIFWDKEKYPIEEIEKLTVPVILTSFPFCWNEDGTDFVNLTDMYID